MISSARGYTLAVVSFWLGCATAPGELATFDQCSLEAETACTAYGATVAGAPASAVAQLVIGLADRAATLPPEDAGDYWRRIEEIVDAGDAEHEIVNRRAAPSYAGLAGFDLMDLQGAEWSLDNLEEGLEATQKVQQRLLERAEFAIRWGDLATQATAARALALGYARQAELMASVEIPDELTDVARASFRSKRDALAAELRAEGERVGSGVDEHCRRHRLKIEACP